MNVGELIKQRFVLRLQVTLIKVVADDVGFKRHTLKVGGNGIAAVDFGEAHGCFRHIGEPREIRQQLGNGGGRNLGDEFALTEQVCAGWLTPYHHCTSPLQEVESLKLGGIVSVGDELINVLQLFIREFAPVGGNGEVDVEILHIKIG